MDPDEVHSLNDLLYADEPKIRELILEQYPEAKLEGDYDEIHEERLSVVVTTSRMEWYRFLIRKGLAGISFVFQIGLRTKEEIGKISSAMDTEKPGWRTRQ